MKYVYIAALAAVIVAQAVSAAPSQAKPKKDKPVELERTLFSGSESLFSEFGWARNDCTSTAADVRTIEAPSHGELRVEQVVIPQGLSSKTYQERCKGKPSQVSRLYYKAGATFVGRDRIVVDVDTKLGRMMRVTYLITVTRNGARESEAQTGEIMASSVLSGNETRLGAMHYVNIDCTSGGLPDVRIVTKPQHGDYRMDPITIPINRPANTVFAACNGKPVEAVGVFYKPKDAFKGEDTVALDVDFKHGKVRRFTYKITVQ
ncbi:hypothetical protein ASD45_12990 [Pseudolabrys sp. Root1462]|uniref:hypothetical protein n=1 Tax=Pseudolabrys sp. Root1462 TaxID=1736466 RepID=UPI000702653A|nr:hypothetical protein [Pseudolabrys sp. Root1462]KQZ01667.1 hypothetical protein ASD45_12990 [Pseudolabrys sp. Root1462]